MVKVGVLFVQEAQAGMRPECDLWNFGPHAAREELILDDVDVYNC